MHLAYNDGMSIPRTANLLGALALAAAERVQQAVDEGARHGAAAPAALSVIGGAPGCSIDFLARVLGLSHSGTVRLVDRLQSDGLLERRPADDGRAVALHLSSAGRRAARRALNERQAALEGMVAKLTAGEREQLTALLERMLPPLVGDLESAYHLCRLCDGEACPPDRCPVDLHLAAAGLLPGPGTPG